jgi:hypothetical protein
MLVDKHNPMFNVKSNTKLREMNQTVAEALTVINLTVLHPLHPPPPTLVVLDPHPILVLVELGLLKSNFNNCPK